MALAQRDVSDPIHRFLGRAGRRTVLAHTLAGVLLVVALLVTNTVVLAVLLAVLASLEGMGKSA